MCERVAAVPTETIQQAEGGRTFFSFFSQLQALMQQQQLDHPASDAMAYLVQLLFPCEACRARSS